MAGSIHYNKSFFSCIIFFFIMTTCLGVASGETVEDLFSQALQEKGEHYLAIRATILSLKTAPSFLIKESDSTDLSTRILARVILDRNNHPDRYQHYEELMIVPMTQAVKHRRMHITGARPFETIKRIAQNPINWEHAYNMNMGMSQPLEKNLKSHCHDESAFLFLAEMALKNTMSDVPQLSEQIEWLDKNKQYTINEAASMLGISPQTADVWHKAGLFHSSRTRHIDFSLPIAQSQVKAFYQSYSDKIINPEYLRSSRPVSRVSHSDLQQATQRFQEDPGSLFRCYAVLMIDSFEKPEVPDLLFEVFKTDKSDYVRRYCVEGFSAKRQVDQICQAMKDSAWRVQHAAAMKSKENLSAFSVSEYLSLLSLDNRLSREAPLEAVIYILKEKKDAAAIKPLIKMYENPYANRAITDALISIDPNSLYQALEHSNPKIRQNVWHTVDRSVFPLSKEYLINYLNTYPDYYGALKLIADEYPDTLPAFLEHDKPEIRSRAISFLGESPDRYFKENSETQFKTLLLKRLQDPTPYVRTAALVALRKYRHDGDIAAIYIEGLNNPDPYYRNLSLQYGNPDIETLDKFLAKETDVEVQNVAFNALLERKNPSRNKIFMKYVHHDDPNVRVITAKAFGEFKNEQTMEALKTLLDDTDIKVQRQAVESIAQIDITWLSETLPDLKPELRQTAYYHLDNIDGLEKGTVINLLIKGTQDHNPDVRNAALWQLFGCEDRYNMNHPVIPIAQRCLKDDSPIVRKNAISILYQITRDKSLEQIARCLYDSDKDVRETASQTIGGSKDTEMVKPLLDALSKEEDKEVLVALVKALESITGNLLTKDEWMQWQQKNPDVFLK